MKTIVTILVILVFITNSYCQIGVPKNRILRDIDQYTETISGDTTIITFYDVVGHVFFIPINRFENVWYFVNDISVRVIAKQTVFNHAIDKFIVKRKWIKKDDYYVKGNKAVRFNDRKYYMWKHN